MMIYLNDHPPAHVHVSKAGSHARIRLEPVEMLHNYGFSPRDMGRILSIVAENQMNLLAKWDRIHPER